MASPEPQPKGLPTLVYWLFPYTERVMGQQGQRGILVPEGYNFVSIGERRCNIKGRMQLMWKNESALSRLGLQDVFTGTIGSRVRYDLPNYILQGIMVNLRGVSSFSNYLCFMDNILTNAQLTFGLNTANLIRGQQQYMFRYDNIADLVGKPDSGSVQFPAYSLVANSLGEQNAPRPQRLYPFEWEQTIDGDKVQKPDVRSIPAFHQGNDFPLTYNKGAFWGSSKSFQAPFYRESERYPISDRRLELELWAPQALNLELTVYPTIDQGSYTYLWPGEELSEWVNINPMSGTMPIKQFYWVAGEGPVQLAEYSYTYHVDYFLEVKLHPSLD